MNSIERARVEDSLFSEAEKIGIDVREDAGSSLLFNFFDAEVAPDVCGVQLSDALPSSTSAGNAAPLGVALDVPVVDDANLLDQGAPSSQQVSLPSLTTVHVKAFSFHRDM